MRELFRKSKKYVQVLLSLFLLLPLISCNVIEVNRNVRASSNEIINKMSLEEKVGQMIMGGFVGKEVNADAKSLIEEGNFGSIILFSDNIEDPVKTAKLTNGLQKIADETDARIPLFIATDQEGGIVTRLKKGVTELPGNMALGATRNPQLANQAGQILGKELRAVGIQMNLAPSVDVNSNPKNPVIGIRSFGENPQMVAEMSAQMIKGMQSNGVMATAKHFPGHGDTKVDSHKGLPVIKKSLQQLKKVELVPFRKAIQSNVGAIMSAHIDLPKLTNHANVPATLSKSALTSLLRKQMNYNGLIITDSLVMKGVTKTAEEVPQKAVQAVQAGADIVLLTPELSVEEQLAVHEELVEAVEEEKIDEELIDRSVWRIIQAKKKYQIFKNSQVDTQKIAEKVNTKANQLQAQNMANQSITVVKNKGIIPLKKKSQQKIGVISSKSLLKYVHKYNPNAQELIIDTKKPTKKQIQQAVAFARQKNLLVVTTENASFHPEQVRLLKRLQKLYKPIIVIGLGNPYELKKFSKIEGYVAAYGKEKTSLQAAIDVIFGEQSPTGKLPVTIPGLYKYGHGLQIKKQGGGGPR